MSQTYVTVKEAAEDAIKIARSHAKLQSRVCVLETYVKLAGTALAILLPVTISTLLIVLLKG